MGGARTYLVELYLPGGNRARVEESAAQARAAAGALAAEGLPVRYVRSIFVPEDETWFLLYEAPSAEMAREASRRAGLRCDRVLEAIEQVEAT